MSQEPIYNLLQVGMKLEFGSHTFEADEIIRYAKKYDPQRFHVSEEGARNSIFGRLCASGWHTGAVWMRYNMAKFSEELKRLTEYRGTEPIIGPSPGLRDLKWPAPVYVGDTITFSSTLTGKRPSPRRAGWGLLTVNSTGVNQDGVMVISMDGAVSIRMD
ncbi:MAG: MaoC family dehydratase [Rhizobiaceae bacterium]